MGTLNLPIDEVFGTFGQTAFTIYCPAEDGGGATAIDGEAYGNDPYGDWPIGVYGATDVGWSVAGAANGSGIGGYFYSSGGTAIQAYSESQEYDAVNVHSSSNEHAAISASNSAGGSAIWASISGTPVASNQPPVAGYFNSDNGVAIVATNKNQAYDTIITTCGSAQHAAVAASNDGGGPAIWANGTTAGYFIGQHIVDGNAQVTGDHTVTGDVNVTGDVFLTNSSGDLAEEFDVEDNLFDREPGTVLVIGSNGRLCACTEAYDTRVAGVVSGAGELKPAIILQRIETAHPRSPVALVGKAFCKVDATIEKIHPGDLLTTSTRHGYAMKLVDYTKATGAILGKALAGLDDGRGLIPILVSPR